MLLCKSVIFIFSGNFFQRRNWNAFSFLLLANSFSNLFFVIHFMISGAASLAGSVSHGLLESSKIDYHAVNSVPSNDKKPDVSESNVVLPSEEAAAAADALGILQVGDGVANIPNIGKLARF